MLPLTEPHHIYHNRRLNHRFGGGDVIFTDGDVLSIGQDVYSDIAYNAIADSVAGASANMNGDEDLYIQGDLEVDEPFTVPLWETLPGAHSPIPD